MIISKTTCTGCGACYVSCPVNCISMIENRIGQLIPKIDKAKCTHCNLCKKNCPQNNIPKEYATISCYAAWSKSPDDYIFSASGGVAATFARYQLNNNGIIYGCDYDSEGNLKHFRVNDNNDISKMQSSKYSQSNAFVCFPEIKKLLENKMSVVFVGTPCQVAALLRYLKKEYSNLITIDLVCHGAPPNQYLRKHLHELKLKAPYQKIRFRGEYDQMLTVWKDNNIVYKKDREEDIYFSAFYENMISYDSCFFCQYAQPKRISDITIGDFWGLGELKNIAKISDRPSLILVNTKKGQQFFKNASGNLIYERREVMEGVLGNGRLNKPPGKNDSAKLFQRIYKYNLLSFDKTVKTVHFVLESRQKRLQIKQVLSSIKNKLLKVSSIILKRKD